MGDKFYINTLYVGFPIMKSYSTTRKKKKWRVGERKEKRIFHTKEREEMKKFA